MVSVVHWGLKNIKDALASVPERTLEGREFTDEEAILATVKALSPWYDIMIVRALRHRSHVTIYLGDLGSMFGKQGAAS